MSNRQTDVCFYNIGRFEATTMIQFQTVSGFFDNVAEAQQAVQHLLAQGFTHKTIKLATPHDPPVATNDETTKDTSSSGRFLDALFGSQTKVPFRGIATITVQSQSDFDANKVANLLYEAGAKDVLVENG